MAQKQHRSLLNAGSLLDFAQKLNPASSSRGRRSSSPAGSQTSVSPHELPSPTGSDTLSVHLGANPKNVPNSPRSCLPNVDAVDHGEEAALVLTSGEISRLASTNPVALPGQQRLPETTSVPHAVHGQRESLSPDGRVDSGSLRSYTSGSEQSLVSVGNKSSGSPPVVVVDGEKLNKEDRLDNCGEEEETEGSKEGGSMISPSTRPNSDKEVKRSTSLKRSFLRSLKPHKDRRSSGSVSKEGSGIDSDTEVHDFISVTSPNVQPIHPSQSCPAELPLLEESSSQPGFETSGSSIGSPTDKSLLQLKFEKDDKSSSSGKRSKKSSPWYSVLSSSYRSKSEEFRKYFKNIHDSEKLIADYSCALQKDILVQGRMYVTENWLCFYANIFKWETLLTVRLKEITAITKERTIRLIPNAIQVATKSDKYFFTSFMSRDRTFLLLFKVWQNALLDQKMPPMEYWTRVHSYYGDNLGLGDDLPEDYIRPSLVSDGRENEFDESKSQGTEGMDEEEECNSGDLSEMDGDKESEVKVQDAAPEGQDVEAAKILDEEGEVKSLETKPLNAKEYMDSFFKVTTDDFFAAMYSNEHPFYRNFLMHRKHTDIVIGDWQKESEERDVREVSYTLHLNNPIGPKSCGVEEKQILHKNWSRPGHSYVVDIEICQKGVPYADYFYTEARMVITRVSSTSCHVRVVAHLIYKKSAWGLIKGFIEKNADSGVKSKHVELDAYVKQHLETRASVSTVTKKTKKPKKRKHLNGTAKEEVEEQQARPMKRKESMPKINTKTNSTSGYLNTWLKVDSKTIMLLICIFLTFLSIVNVSLFLQLQSLEQLAGKANPEMSSTHFPDKLKDIPETREEWSTLLEKQLLYHELEMDRWREVVGLCIDLMKKMEVTLQELHNSIKPIRMQDLDEELNGANRCNPER